MTVQFPLESYPPLPDRSSPSWRDRAACRGLPAETFFPGRGELTTEAERVCAGCTVRAECLDDSLTAPFERFGVWGGLAEHQRRRLRNQRRQERDAS